MMCTTPMQILVQITRGCWMAWNWSYRRMGATKWEWAQTQVFCKGSVCSSPALQPSTVTASMASSQGGGEPPQGHELLTFDS